MSDHYTQEGTGLVDATRPDAVEEARKRHHLATADPEVERGDGTLTGPAHERKYGLEREEASASALRGVGVHPYENRALRPDEDGYEHLRGVAALETTRAASAPENADAPRPLAPATAAPAQPASAPTITPASAPTITPAGAPAGK